MIDRALLTELLRVYPWQPASAYFRAVELSHLFARGPAPPEGHALDFGCGDGEVTRIYDAHYPGARTWDGVDMDIMERELAARAAMKAGSPFLLTVPGPDFHWHLRTNNVVAFDLKHAIRTLWDEGRWWRALTAAGFKVHSCTTYLNRGEVRRWEILTGITSGVLCTLTGRRYRPIEIQRKLGLRRRQRMPRWMVRALAALLTLPLRSTPDQNTHYAITAVM